LSKKYLIDLFAGCGGLSLGLEQAGFIPVFVNELNKDAIATYKINRIADCPWLEENSVNDIKNLVLNKSALPSLKKRLLKDFNIKDIDLIAGGPPCQGYSGIGHRRSYSVDKKQLPSNHLYEDMAYVIYKMKPKMFLFENVRGLLNARWTEKGVKGEIWQDVLGKFSSLTNYNLGWSLVYAKDYGVPQNRPRVLLVGVRKDIKFKENLSSIAGGLLPEPTNGAPNIEEIFSDLVDVSFSRGGETLSYPNSARTKWQRYYRQEHKSKKIKRKGSPLTEHQYSKHSDHIVKKFKYMINNSGKIHQTMKTKKFAQRLLPRRWDKEKGPTITATSLPDDYVHYTQPRSLTVREWARLQTFPDWYQFSGKRTTGGIRRAGNPRDGIHEREVPKYTQIGNAVPVKLAYEVGKHFINILS
jgi:DNA (cytosine-5)-methyltransferase 1